MSQQISNSKWLPVTILLCLSMNLRANGMDLIKISRNSCVEVSSKSGDSRGTGFFIDGQHVVTCFHVIAKLNQNGRTINWSIHQDLKIKLSDGEVLDGVVLSVPSERYPEPLHFDFAVIKLKVKPAGAFETVQISTQSTNPEIGSDIVFSGYPLDTPAMVTHKGMVSGIDPTGNIICLEAPINKGNSGGAVLSQDGAAVGIVDMREGGISKGLQDLRGFIKISGQYGSVQMVGVDPLKAIGAIIDTLDKYISTGIGYAVSIKHLRNYIQAHPEVER